MFVVSNGSDTKYFSAARDTELNPKFMSRWTDKGKEPVSNYIDFAKQVLRIPQAHKMVSRYMVLDYDKKRLILLRPYQIHAIEAMGEASKNGKSGFIWHMLFVFDKVLNNPERPGIKKGSGETREEFEKKMRDLRKIVEDYSKDNQIIADLLSKILDEIEEDREKYANEDISVILYKMKNEIISAVADAFVKMWRVGSEEVINNFLDSRHGEIPYEQELRRSMDYKAYCEECEQSGEKPLPKFMAKKAMQSDMKRVLKEEIVPLEDIE